MPKMVQKYGVNWYHPYLLHLIMDQTYNTISHHYYCFNLRDDIRIIINFS